MCTSLSQTSESGRKKRISNDETQPPKVIKTKGKGFTIVKQDGGATPTV
jgi:hypothetical protein